MSPSRAAAGAAARHRPMSWLWLSLAVLVLDQATKALALELLVLHRPVAVAPSLNLTLTYNTGAAFSLLSDAGGWQRWLFVGLAVAVCGFLLSWLRSVGAGDRWTPMALALVLGGAAGNLLDRVMRDGRVVDFIDVYVGQWHWPAFNVADSGICVGAVILIWKALEREPQD